MEGGGDTVENVGGFQGGFGREKTAGGGGEKR